MNRNSLFFTLFLLLLTLLNPAWATYSKSLVTGTPLENPTTNWNAGDDDSLQVNLGFSFPFGGVTSTDTLYINSNGGLSLSPWSAYGNTALPTSPTTLIAPYWDDLNRAQGGTIKYGTFGTPGNRRFVVAWDQVPRYNTSTLCTFQVVLYENGDIRFRYGSNSQCNGISATIGVQESNSVYNQHSYNSVINLGQDILYTSQSTPPPPPPPATPLAVNICDDFEKDLSNWTISGNGNIGTQTYASATRSLFINGGNSSATSIPVNTSTNFKEVTVWIRRGSDTFSENPDTNEDLYIEYLSSTNTWNVLEQIPGAGTQGEIFNRTYTAPADAQHGNFRLRFRMPNGSGINYDFWHIDNVCLVPSVPFPNISISKTSSVIYDPVNLNTNPKRIPGATIEYTISVSNSGTGQADNNSVIIKDAIPPGIALYVNDISGTGTGPVRFVDGTPPSGLSYTFSSLASSTDSLSFSADGGNSFNYSPTPDAQGVDSNITHIRVTPQGSLQASSLAGTPGFQLKFRVIVQ